MGIVNGRGLPPLEPWFYRRPRMAAAGAVVAYAALGVWGTAQPGAREAAGAIAVLPTALLAVTCGRRGGLGAGAAALAAFGAWAAVGGHDVDGPSWAGIAALVALGILLGDAVQRHAASEGRATAAEATAALAEQVANRHRAASEINDGIIQEVAAAKWALESGRVDRAVSILDDAVANGQRLVSNLLAERD